MRFESIDVTGFGNLVSTAVESIQPGLVIIEGHNGAGKSTALDFLTSLLFGYSVGSGANKYEGTPGSLRGGSASIRTRDGRVSLWKRGGIPPAAGKLTVTINGDPIEDPSSLIGKATRSLYQSVFALSIDQLRSEAFRTEQQSAIESAITGTGIQGLPTAIKSIDSEIRALEGELKKQKLLLTKAKEDEERARATNQEYESAVRSQETANSKLAEVEAAFEIAKQRHELFQRLSKAWNPWCRYLEAEDALKNLPASKALDENSVQKARASAGKVDVLANSTLVLQTRLDVLQEKLEQIELLPEVQAESLVIESLLAELTAVHDAEGILNSLRERVSVAKRELDEALRQLGPDWQTETLQAVDLSFLTAQSGDEIVKQLAGQKKVYAELEGQIAQIERDRQRLSDEVDKLNSKILEEFSPAPATNEEIDAREASLGPQQKLELKLDIAREELQKARTKPRPTEKPQVSRALLLALAAFTLILILAGWSLAKPLVLGLGLVGLLVTVGLLFFTNTSTGSDPESSISEREALVKELESQLDQISVGSVTVSSIRKERARRMELDGLQSRLLEAQGKFSEIEGSLSPLQTQLSIARQNLEASWNEWNRWRELAGYPNSLAPESLASFNGHVATARAKQTEKSQAEKALEAAEQKLSDVRDRMEALKCFQITPGAKVYEQLLRLRDLLHRARVAGQKFDSQSDAIEQLKDELRLSLAALEKEKETLTGLLRELNVRSKEELEAAVKVQEQVQSLEEKRRAAEATLVVLSAPGEPYQMLKASLAEVTDGTSLQEDAQSAEEDYKSLSAQLIQVRDELNHAKGRVQTIEDGADQRNASARLAEVEALIASIQAKWLEATVTKMLLENAKETFQGSVQKSVLETSSSFMRALTNEEVVEIRREDDGNFTLLESTGQRKTLSQANRSLAERVLLAVRLGYIEAYSVDCEPLPIIFDDILVNFDAEHQAFAARTIHEVAQKHQVIYLTCHKTTSDVFRAVDANFQYLELSKSKFEEAKSRRKLTISTQEALFEGV